MGEGVSSRQGGRGRDGSSPEPVAYPRGRGRPIHVVVADEDRLIRQAIRRHLSRAGDLRVVAEVTYGGLAVPVLRHRTVEVVVMDLQPTLEEGLLAVRTLTAPGSHFRVCVVVMTNCSSASCAGAVMDAGAAGYLLKSRDIGLLPSAVRAAVRGERTVSAGTPLRTRPSAAGTLTPLERAVVRGLSRGAASNEALAAELGLSVNAVRGQLGSSLRKLGLKDRAHLARWAALHGLDEVDPSEPRRAARPPGQPMA